MARRFSREDDEDSDAHENNDHAGDADDHGDLIHRKQRGWLRCTFPGAFFDAFRHHRGQLHLGAVVYSQRDGFVIDAFVHQKPNGPTFGRVGRPRKVDGRSVGPDGDGEILGRRVGADGARDDAPVRGTGRAFGHGGFAADNRPEMDVKRLGSGVIDLRVNVEDAAFDVLLVVSRSGRRGEDGDGGSICQVVFDGQKVTRYSHAIAQPFEQRIGENGGGDASQCQTRVFIQRGLPLAAERKIVRRKTLGLRAEIPQLLTGTLSEF